MRTSGGAVWVWVTLACASVASAQERAPQEAEAEQEFRAADEAYASERWLDAATRFERSYRLLTEIDHPRRGWVAYNVGRSLEHIAGRERDAIDWYERFLSETTEAADDPDGVEQRAQARARIAELRARVGTGGGISPIGPIVIGAGAAVLIAGAITGIAAVVQHDEIASQCDETTCPTRLRDAASEMEALAIATDVLLPVGVAAVAAGLVLTVVLQDSETTASAAVGPNSARLTLAWRLP